MSNDNYTDYSRRNRSYEGLVSGDAETRARAERERSTRVARAREDIDRGVAKPSAPRDTRRDYDESAVRLGITAPSKKAERLRVVLVDNSGSNAAIAKHLKRSSGHLLATLKLVDPGSEVATIYFSDHTDGERLMQEVDYVAPTPKGEKTLISTIENVFPANGGDAPEAIECALWRACEIDFGKVPKEHRHLYLVSDQVAHGMGVPSTDGGCPDQRDWRESVARVRKTYGTFEIVGSGIDPHVAKLQEQFLEKGRVSLDFVDLSEIESERHRQNITGNALLFLIARERGTQTVQAFLMALYEKWLSDPIFGTNTDLEARKAIRRFAKYLELPKSEVDALMASVVA